MKRNKRRRRRVPDYAAAAVPSAPPRAVVTLVQWAVWFAMAGLLVAFVLIASLYLRWRLPDWVWVNLWPPSFHLMDEAARSPRRELLFAYALALENAFLYAAAGLVLGALRVGFRRLRSR